MLTRPLKKYKTNISVGNVTGLHEVALVRLQQKIVLLQQQEEEEMIMRPVKKRDRL